MWCAHRVGGDVIFEVRQLDEAEFQLYRLRITLEVGKG